MPSYSPPRKNIAYVFYVSLVSQANTKIMLANPTLASGDVKVAIDDGAPANLATLPTVDADFTKRVKVELSQAEMNGDRITVIFSDASGDAWCDLTVDIATSARQIDDLAYPATSGRSTAIDASGQVTVGAIANNAITAAAINADAITAAKIADGAIDAATFAAGAINAAAIATNAIDADALAADAIAEINATVDTALADYDAPTKAELDAAVAPLATQASVDDLPTSSELATALSSADDATLAAIGALNNLSAAQVNTEVDSALADAALATAANLATVAGYLDTEIAAILADTNELQSDWANGGRLDLLVDAILDDTGTAGVVVAAGSKTGYALASNGLDSISVTAPSGVASNFREMVIQLWRRFFKKSTLTSSELKTYADNGTDALTTQAVSDDETTQTMDSAT
jgi:hypothetical protein